LRLAIPVAGTSLPLIGFFWERHAAIRFQRAQLHAGIFAALIFVAAEIQKVRAPPGSNPAAPALR